MARHGATAGIAYLGFIDTDLATEVFADDHAAAIRRAVPGFITAPMSLADAAAAVLSGIKRRAPRVSAPGWVAPLLAARSITTAVMDQVLLTNPEVARAVDDAESDSSG